MSFWRHEEIYRSDVGLGEARNGNGCRRSPHSSGCDEFPVGYSSAGCSPAVPASASPPGNDSQQPMLPYNDFAASGNNPLNSVSQPKGALQNGPSPPAPRWATGAVVFWCEKGMYRSWSVSLNIEVKP